MRKSEIKLTISLDTQNVPTAITWEASENPVAGPQSTKAFALSIWEPDTSSVLKIDLWDNNMMVHEMKGFMIQTIGGLGETLMNATGDQAMKSEIDNLCAKLSLILKDEMEGKKA